MSAPTELRRIVPVRRGAIGLRAAILGGGLALAGLIATVPGPASADLRDWLPFGKTHRIAKLLPAVVNIETISYKKDAKDPSGPPRRAEAFGSGFVVDASGLIATNHHVIDGASEINITFTDGKTLKATVVGDAGFNIDLALLKVDPDKPLPVVKWGNSRDVRVGDSVFVVGNPLGVGESVSAGIVSALNRNITETPYDDFIQTDAAINHGNSGGPLVNTRGDVIGVATALFSPTDSGSVGLGFAIPAYDVEFVIDRLRKFGGLHFGYLGMRMQDITAAMADALGLSPPRGAIIASVVPDSPASAAGIKEGDVMLRFDNQTFPDIRALGRMIATAKIDAPATLSVWRDGKEQKVTATIKLWPEAMPAEANGKPAGPARKVSTNPAELGMNLAPISDAARQKFKLADGQTGVLVSDITPNSTASDQGIAAGDVIMRVQEQPVSTPEEVQQHLADARAHDHHFALLLVQKQDQREWIPLPIAPGG